MRKVLVVDDEKVIRRLVEVTLSTEDYKIIQADNGKDAVEIAGSEKPDLIIMDIMMPGDMDGLEAVRILKNDPETKDSFIIMLTAKGQDDDRKKCLEAGADDYLAKPFSPLELINKVGETLKG